MKDEGKGHRLTTIQIEMENEIIGCRVFVEAPQISN
jgi:hypothetical protein